METGTQRVENGVIKKTRVSFLVEFELIPKKLFSIVAPRMVTL